MCMESHLVTLLKRLNKEDHYNIIECIELKIANKKNDEKVEGIQQTLSKMKDILAEYETHEG
ncbi:hypothetical protein [Geosporobacter ferrireducens]|uniref:Uncharacterized protein n=1 Tax=Geosporobacter ferrireducens TaxID=1424294 RepID=A0A1D8GL63_9FIRM|nr:hypothetical protein [Geosporobacter ferrireducens]AOT71642.1 hypothetical protein Gferi_20140 [Geosporobacter ferrireducens]MTI55408.1 hypothetical protein [Geosporobacter ferrireducens]